MARASMRPRVFPAEDGPHSVCRPTGCGCFNEAAGIPRGRRAGRGESGADAGAASMRPRVFPAEDLIRVVRVPPDVLASMRPRVFPAEDAVERRRVARDAPVLQ